MLGSLIRWLISLFFSRSRTGSGVNLSDGIDANDVIGILEQMLNNNGGTLNLPPGTLPANVMQQIENHYQTNGGLSSLPPGTVKPEHLIAIKAHSAGANPSTPHGAQHKG